jgi:hypothetical protein
MLTPSPQGRRIPLRPLRRKTHAMRLTASRRLLLLVILMAAAPLFA